MNIDIVQDIKDNPFFRFCYLTYFRLRFGFVNTINAYLKKTFYDNL